MTGMPLEGTSSDVFVHHGLNPPLFCPLLLPRGQDPDERADAAVSAVQGNPRRGSAPRWENLVYRRTASAETLQHAKLRVGSLVRVRELVQGRMYKAEYQGNTQNRYRAKRYKGQLIHLPRETVFSFFFMVDLKHSL